MQNLTAKAAKSLYALKTLKAHGLQGRALWDVTQATLVAQITYAGPSWRGFIKAEETARLKAVLLKARHYGYLPTDFLSLDDLLDSSDESLFRSIRYNPQHVLHELLPPPKHTVPVDMASPSLLSLRRSCTKSSITACYSMMIYINVIQTGLYFVYIFAILYVYTVCLYCDCLLCVWQSFIKEFCCCCCYCYYNQDSISVVEPRQYQWYDQSLEHGCR